MDFFIYKLGVGKYGKNHPFREKKIMYKVLGKL